MKSYRPIALIPILAKVFEKVIHDSLNNYFDKNNLFTDNQKGFRKNKRTDVAIYELRKEALYMDMTKAFNYVNRSILIKKLNAYGVRGNVSKLLESYLTNR